jgi:hypothetical protein
MFGQVAAALRNLDDSALDEVEWGITRLLKDSLADGHDWNDPIPQAYAQMAGLAFDEHNHRLATLWEAEADLRGGHFVVVGVDGTELGKWQADCYPVFDGDECWSGPNRETEEEAIRDGRAHNPPFEPET